jgi:DNA repair exonuclease SbcCD ATPase subunit
VATELDTVRQVLFGADLARLEQALAADRQTASGRAHELEARIERGLKELEQRVERRLEEIAQRVTAQLEDLSRRQQAHADKVTQLLDQVMAELTRRSDALASDTRAGVEEMKARAADLERRKLNVADFAASLAMLGQRFATPSDEGRGS